jgi:hypothetical protein
MRLHPAADLNQQQLTTEHCQRIENVIHHCALLYDHRRTFDASQTRQARRVVDPGPTRRLVLGGS